MGVHRRGLFVLITSIALITITPAFTATALAPGSDPFQRTWTRTDAPVAALQVERTWVWGPAAFTAPMHEPYGDHPGDTRVVQYFDKARMEVTYPAADRTRHWYVTNGLLVVELVSGRLQTADNAFDTREPAVINVAGDPTDPAAPTYATFTTLRTVPPAAANAPITARLARDGTVIADPALAAYGVTAAERVQAWGIDHRVASVFWEYMHSEGLVSVGGQTTTGPLAPDTFYATGLPLTEAYWATVQVRGIAQDVLIQCFERRCLTWTPANAPEWRVEMGNVGQHYFRWRYGIDTPTEPVPVEHGSTHLPPTPLDAWDVDHDGLTRFRMSNQTPHEMTMRLTGPVNLALTVPACPDCPIYPRSEPPLACRSDTPHEEALLPPGNYRIEVEYTAPDTDRSGGHWTLTPDTTIDTCWVLVAR